MTSGVVLYILASFSRISVLGTVERLGCNTSTTCKLKDSHVADDHLSNLPKIEGVPFTEPLFEWRDYNF